MTDRWDRIFTEDLQTNDDDNAISAMVEFQGDIYIGTDLYNPTKSGNIYCHKKFGYDTPYESKAWEEVATPWPTSSHNGLFSYASGVALNAMVVFKNHLYIGIERNEIWHTSHTSDNKIRVSSASSQVWRTSDGKNWSDYELLEYPSKIGAVAVFKDYLYVAFHGNEPSTEFPSHIYRTSDGDYSWEEVAIPLGYAPHCFDTVLTINALEVFEDYLYAGGNFNYRYVNGKRDDTKGFRLCRTKNGTDWEMFKEVLLSTAAPNGATEVHTLKTFKDKLYVGGYPGKVVWRTDGAVKADGKAAVWQEISAIKSGNIFRMEERDKKLYLAVNNPSSKDPFMYYSENGEQWKPVEGGPNGDSKSGEITLLSSHYGILDVGTKTKSQNYLMGKSLELWELGPEIWRDVGDLVEPNNTKATAEPLKLDPTKTETWYNPYGPMGDRTLHSDDLDFFEVEYQSKSSPLEECWPLAQNKFSVPGGGGMFHVEHYQECLSIHAKEEYGRSLRIEIYCNKEDKEPYIKNFTSNEIKIKCPSRVFPNKKLLLAIKPPDEPKTCRYNLYFNFSNKSASVIVGKLLYDYRESLPAPYPPPPFRKLIDPTTKYDDIDKFLTDSEKYLSEFIDYSSQIEQASLRHKLGYTSYLAGSYDRAERFYEQSLTIFKKLEIPTKEAEVLRSLGGLNSAQEKTIEAVKNFEDAAKIHQQLEDEEGLAYDLMALGNHYLRTGEPYESLVALEEALALQIRLPDMSGELLNFLDQSEAFLKLDQKEAAVACHILAEELSSRIEDETMSKEVAQRQETIAAQIGEQEFLELEERLAEKAEKVRYEAISEILEGQNLD